MKLFVHRVVEELYDFEADLDARTNLVDKPEYQAVLAELRSELETWMVAHGDPALEAFRNRRSPSYLAAFMDEQKRRGQKLVAEGNKPSD